MSTRQPGGFFEEACDEESKSCHPAVIYEQIMQGVKGTRRKHRTGRRGSILAGDRWSDEEVLRRERIRLIGILTRKRVNQPPDKLLANRIPKTYAIDSDDDELINWINTPGTIWDLLGMNLLSGSNKKLTLNR